MITLSKTIEISQCDLKMIQNVKKQTIKQSKVVKEKKTSNDVLNFAKLKSPTIWKFNLKKWQLHQQKLIGLSFSLYMHKTMISLRSKKDRTNDIFYE